MSVYGGVPAADRQADRRARLLAAALELFGTQGWGATTVRGVCAQARLTPRYFYESFADRDALVVTLFDELAAAAAGAVLAALPGAGADARAKARAAIGAFVTFVEADPRCARVLFIEATGCEPLVARRLEALRMFAALAAGQARDFYGMPEVSDPAVEIGSLMLVGGLAETLLAWVDGTLAVDRDGLVDDLVELFVSTGEAAVRIVRARS